MDLKYGINGSFAVESARPTTVESSTPILLLATVNAGGVDKFEKFNNAEAAVAYVTDNAITSGTLEAAAKAINAQGINCPVVVYLIDELADEATQLAALDKFVTSEPTTGINPRLGVLIAPELSAATDVGTKIDVVASKLWATGITDDFSADEAGFKNYMSNFASKNMLHTTGRTKVDGVLTANSAVMAGIIARYDGEPFGWAKSHSNRVVLGASDTDRVIEFVQGSDCEARRLRQEGGCLILKNEGWRTYGFQTRDIDPIWQMLSRVRTFHRCMDAIIKASLWALDREADELLEVKKTVTQFMNELIGNGVAIGFEVYFDSTKNTKATVSAGKFYLTVKFQDMPEINELNIEMIYTDAYSDVLINYLNQGE